MKKPWILSFLLSAERRLWLDCADAQADLSLRWAHRSFCLFCHAPAHVFSVEKHTYLTKTGMTSFKLKSWQKCFNYSPWSLEKQIRKGWLRKMDTSNFVSATVTYGTGIPFPSICQRSQSLGNPLLSHCIFQKHPYSDIQNCRNCQKSKFLQLFEDTSLNNNNKKKKQKKNKKKKKTFVCIVVQIGHVVCGSFNIWIYIWAHSA